MCWVVAPRLDFLYYFCIFQRDQGLQVVGLQVVGSHGIFAGLTGVCGWGIQPWAVGVASSAWVWWDLARNNVQLSGCVLPGSLLGTGICRVEGGLETRQEAWPGGCSRVFKTTFGKTPTFVQLCFSVTFSYCRKKFEESSMEVREKVRQKVRQKVPPPQAPPPRSCPPPL